MCLLMGWWVGIPDGDVQEAIHDSLDGFSLLRVLPRVIDSDNKAELLGFYVKKQPQVVLPPLLDLSNSEFTLSGWFKSTALEISKPSSTPFSNILALGYNHGENLNAHVSCGWMTMTTIRYQFQWSFCKALHLICGITLS